MEDSLRRLTIPVNPPRHCDNDSVPTDDRVEKVTLPLDVMLCAAGDNHARPIFQGRPPRPRQISLRFATKVSLAIRPRISYAFRVFAAIYGYNVVEPGREDPGLCFLYGVEAPPAQYPLLHVPARYKDVRYLDAWKRSLVRHQYADEEFLLAFGVDPDSGKPDWLGELFLWLSGSYEFDILDRDSVGRVPYSEMVFGRCDVVPRKPHACMLMAWMQNALVLGNSGEALPPAPSPVPEIQHVVISSHDVDFYFVDRVSALLRLLKNLAIAGTTSSWSFFYDNLRMILQLARGARVGDFLPALLKAGKNHGFRSTLFVVPRRGHRRDPNYSLSQILPLLSDAAEKGFSAGVHGSYRSLMEDRTLRTEVQALRRITSTMPLAGRQHWLRFSDPHHLFSEISGAGLLCDSTLGFSDQIGFRNGAGFAFPPYDFVNARPHQFLEIPLVLMDVGLYAASRSLRKNPQELADEVLAESRKYGWGGVSVLWHNPIEPLAVPSRINDVFWNCVKRQEDCQEKWMSADQFLNFCLQRYQQAGLLEGVRISG